MKSAKSSYTFAIAPQANIPRARFKMDHTYKTTFNAGYLVPIELFEVLPGDSIRFSVTLFSRLLSPLKSALIDNLYLDVQAFYVPHRLIHDEYEEFFGSSAGQSGNWEYDDSHLLPGITAPAGGWKKGSIADYFGIPIGVEGLRVNALPFRAYNKIIADHYLPSSYELVSPVVKTDSTDDTDDLYVLHKRIKRPDYLTTALISPQRGPGVELPLGASAPVIGNGDVLGLTNGIKNGALYANGGNVGGSENLYGSHVGTTQSGNLLTGNTGLGVTTDPAKSGLVADLSSATATTINSLRQAFQLQRALERDMRGGVRYVEQLKAHFGVTSPDARLQRSEYLGGGHFPINIHTVANTNGATGSNLGDLAAYAVGAQTNIGFIKSFVEHGYIIILASVRADLTYQQGLPKLFDRWARFDYYYPVFAHLGEQVVKNKEIYAQGPDVKDDLGNIIDDQPFGYQERFAEYRYGVNKITGALRSTYNIPLDSWHLAQKFNNLPTLNKTFLEENVPMSRVKAVTSEDDFILDCLFKVNAVRPMPLFGVPGLVDHF